MQAAPHLPAARSATDLRLCVSPTRLGGASRRSPAPQAQICGGQLSAAQQAPPSKAAAGRSVRLTPLSALVARVIQPQLRSVCAAPRSKLGRSARAAPHSTARPCAARPRRLEPARSHEAAGEALPLLLKGAMLASPRCPASCPLSLEKAIALNWQPVRRRGGRGLGL